MTAIADLREQLSKLVLKGDEAEANFVARKLLGRYTAKDMELYRFIHEQCSKGTTPDLADLAHANSEGNLITFLGEQIWPPK
jgi:hypothetical protein